MLDVAPLPSLHRFRSFVVDDVSTLFRATSLATTLMDQYMKMVANGFLRSALQHPILRITENKMCLEVLTS